MIIIIFCQILISIKIHIVKSSFNSHVENCGLYVNNCSGILYCIHNIYALTPVILLVVQEEYPLMQKNYLLQNVLVLIFLSSRTIKCHIKDVFKPVQTLLYTNLSNCSNHTYMLWILILILREKVSINNVLKMSLLK